MWSALISLVTLGGNSLTHSYGSEKKQDLAHYSEYAVLMSDIDSDSEQEHDSDLPQLPDSQPSPMEEIETSEKESEELDNPPFGIPEYQSNIPCVFQDYLFLVLSDELEKASDTTPLYILYHSLKTAPHHFDTIHIS